MNLATLGSRGVLDLGGHPRMLGALWRRRPALIIWLRHFACLFCKEQASLIHAERARIAQLGARLAFVGHGSLDQARAFRERFVPGAEIYLDPSRYTFRQIGARESVASTVGGLAFHGPRAMRRGYFQTGIQANPFQSGGAMVAIPGDTLVYMHLSRIAGDHPPNHELLTALEQGARRARERDLAAGRPIPETRHDPSMASEWPRQVPMAFPLAAP